MEYKFTIYGKLPGLNDYTKACRGNKFAGSAMKSRSEKQILEAIMIARSQKTLPMETIPGCIHLDYIWYEPSNRRDADNVVFAQKFVQDAMVSAGVIPDDSRKHVMSFSHLVVTDENNPRIEVHITDID